MNLPSLSRNHIFDKTINLIGATMQLPYSEELNIGYLSRLFSNTSECYKLFWFKAIMTKLEENKTLLTFDELINEMIADAWYMVTEYHLNLGPRDNLEAVVKYIATTTNFKPTIEKSKILKYLRASDDKEIIRVKKILISNVPFRLQAPFMPDFKGDSWKISIKDLADEINEKKHLLYYFVLINGLDSEIELADEWVNYLLKNKDIIQGWIRYCLIEYLQRRNPSVPGIIDKLYPPKERDLSSVIKYWKLIMTLQPVREIYGNIAITEKNISIDHFVPWSYVAHDELWNLHPTTKSINSSKSNNLPDWDVYFTDYANQEFSAYQLMWKFDSVHKEFDKCAKKHLNNSEIKYRLYRPNQLYEEFYDNLKEIIFPVYQSAKNSGFGSWIYV